MKRINNKGFLLTETLITTCVIAVLATSLYIYVSKTIDNYEKRDNYENIVDVFSMNSFKTFFETFEKTDTTYNNTNINYKPPKGYCTNEISGTDEDFKKNNGTNLGNINSLFICNLDKDNNYKKNIIDNFSISNLNLKNEFSEYVRLLSVKDIKETNDDFIIIGIFEDSMGRKFSYASIRTGVKSGNTNDYNYYSEPDNSGANVPQLADGMIPVTYNGNKWIIADRTKQWYNYEKQMWANAVTVSDSSLRNAPIGTELDMDKINSMWVWIPRYKYKIPSNIGSSSNVTNPPEIDVVFESDTNTTGSTLADCSISATNCYYTHPAFRDGTVNKKSTNYDQGGWDRELEGIWVGKFETSGLFHSPMIKPDKVAFIDEKIAPKFKAALKFAGGTISEETGDISFTVNANNVYGLNTTNNNTNTHMMKNTEWGAVAYLSQSKYGKMGNQNYNGVNKEVYINNSNSYYTGRSGGGPSESTPISSAYPDKTSTNQTNKYGFYTYDDYLLNYDTNTKGNKLVETGTGASTTGTIYGVYDMSGGKDEAVMGGSGTYLLGFSTVPTNKIYYDMYSTSSTEVNRAIKGDATYETKKWYSDSSSFIGLANEFSWFTRGSTYSSSGIFGYYDDGTAYSEDGFRVVLIP